MSNKLSTNQKTSAHTHTLGSLYYKDKDTSVNSVKQCAKKDNNTESQSAHHQTD